MLNENFKSIHSLAQLYELTTEGEFVTLQLEIKEGCSSKIPKQLNIESIEVDDLFIELDEIDKYDGKVASVTFKKPDGLYNSWVDFLNYRPNLVHCPNFFYLLHDDTVFPVNEPKGKLKHYLDVIKLVNILIEHADYTAHLSDSVIDKVTYLHKSRIDIQFVYDDNNLAEALDGITVFCSYFDDPTHMQQKVSILKESLFSLNFSDNKNNKLSKFINQFGEFSKRFIENYNLFVSEFSFDEVRKEYEEKKRDYFIKLDEIFSSVQSKMLGIPISLALASFKLSSIVDEKSFWSNLFLSISIIVYSAMMIMLIRNQKHSLEALKSEFTSQMNRLKHQYSGQYKKIEGMIIDLNKRHDYQKYCLNWFYVMSASLFLIVIALFIWHLPWKVMLGVKL